MQIAYPNLGEWYKKICELSGKDKALPMNTGAEAVETALKNVTFSA
jgi:ornithine--oxo-acid transaminase